MTTDAKAQILLKTKIKTLLIFFDKITIPYFQNNSYYEINGKYLQGEYAHAELGLIESYQDILGIKNLKTIINVISDRLNGRKLKIKDYCYCGNGRILKKCNFHNIKYREFRMIDKEILYNDLNKIIELVKKVELHSK